MQKKPKAKVQLAVTLGIITAGAMVLAGFILAKPQMEKKRPPVIHPVVRVVTVQTGERKVTVLGEGTVQPLRRSTMSAQVKGVVVSVSPALVNGGSFHKNDLLMRIDDKDYRLAVTLAESTLRSAETGLQKTQEEAQAALHEWRRFNKGRSGRSTPPPLVAKEPQLAEAKARLAAARAQLDQARLNLKRTQVRAPFEGRVEEKHVDLGQYLRAGDRVARLYSTDAAEIVVHLEDRDLAWLQVPGFTQGEDPGSPATVRARFAGSLRTWRGRVVRATGFLDERTRLVPVVVRVEKPYAKRPPLAVGQFVTVEFQGTVLSGAILLPRTALRAGAQVWVVDDGGRLRFRRVEVALRQDDGVLISQGLKPGEKVIVSPLSAVSNGMQVRTSSVQGKEASP